MISAFILAAITVGPNVQVSAANPNRAHYETQIAADPNNPQNLLACSMVSRPRLNQGMHATETSIVYRSGDGGATWQPVLDENVPESVAAAYKWRIGDQVCAFGVHGEAYFSSLRMLDAMKQFPTSFDWYISRDGGKTWPSSPTVQNDNTGYDRQYLTVDTTQSPYRGRVYATVDRTIKRKDVTDVFVSGGPRGFSLLSGVRDPVHAVNANGAILSDGAFAHFYETFPRCDDIRGACPYNVRMTLSTDGGKTFAPAVTIGGGQMTCPLIVEDPVPAADESPSPFHDRLYVAWEATQGGRCRILVSHSSDRGKTWSTPFAVDDSAPRFTAPGPDDFMPELAVNSNGMVAVTWYDRRDSADDRGYDVRMALSSDGGESFSPSFKVSSAPANYSMDRRLAISTADFWFGKVGLSSWDFETGNTSGLTADAAGVFHPLWVDNRTGISQIWTAAVKTDEKARLFSDPALASFTDVSARVRIDLVNAYYDGATHQATMDAYVTNISSSDLQGPLKMRFLDVSSDFGDAALTNADNGKERNGALIDLSDLLPGGVLHPNQQTSRAKQLTFRLANVRPIPAPSRDDPTVFSFVNLRTQILSAGSIYTR